MTLALVKDLRTARAAPTEEDLAAFDTDVMAGFLLARAAAGLADATIQIDASHLDQVRSWFERPLWEMEHEDADRYFGQVLRSASKELRYARAQVLTTFFAFLEMRHAAEVHHLTGRVVTCPIDEANRPRGSHRGKLRIPPSEPQAEAMFASWRDALAECRKFAPEARNFTAARLMSQVGLRVSELCGLDLADIHWELGRFGKLHVRFGKGARGSGPRERMVPLINGADRLLTWYVRDVWSSFDDDHTRPQAPLFASERSALDGSPGRVSASTIRRGVAAAAAEHLSGANPKRPVTPHVLRHYCATQLYRAGMDLVAVQELLGHVWIATTMTYVHVSKTHVEDAWQQGSARAAARLPGLVP